MQEIVQIKLKLLTFNNEFSKFKYLKTSIIIIT
ncbi:hypothetical protein BHO_0083100 [Borrelia hermsii YBT]|nr:hypothetical protein BHO_0083100 [Borrelia hermsii YBT]